MKPAVTINIKLQITAVGARKGVRRNPETQRAFLADVVEFELVEDPSVFLASPVRS
jgi:hypothetical protein